MLFASLINVFHLIALDLSVCYLHFLLNICIVFNQNVVTFTVLLMFKAQGQGWAP